MLLGAEIRREDIYKWPDEVREGDDLWAFESHLEIKFGELCVLIGMTNVIPKCALDKNRPSMILNLLSGDLGSSREIENVNGSFILFLPRNILTSRSAISLYRRLRSCVKNNRELARIRNINFESGL
jgi:hypothetical protein